MSEDLNEQIDSSNNNEEIPQMCDMCQIIPDQYISLKCSHNICLSCITQLYQQSSNDSPGLIICPFDQIDTILDEYSISALQKIIEETQNNENTSENLKNYNEQQIENNDENHSNDENPLTKSNEDFPIETFNKFNGQTQEIENQLMNEKPMTKNIEKKLDNFENSTPKTEKLNDLPYRRINNDHTNNINSETTNKDQRVNNLDDRFREIKDDQIFSPLFFPFCQRHHKETANLYCFTCDVGLLCTECLVDGSHDLHDVKSLGKNFELIRLKNAKLIEKIQKKKQEFSQWISELGSKRKIIGNKIIEAKQQIFNDFKELKEKLESKERELIKRSETYSNQKMIEIDDEITVLKEKFKFLNVMEEKNKLVFQNRENSPEKIIKIYSSLKKDLERFEFKPKSIEELPDFKCYLNMETFYKYLENIQILKLEISSISAKKSLAFPYQYPTNPTKSYLLYNSNNINTSYVENRENGFIEYDNTEIKRKTLHEKNIKIPEYSFDKRKCLYVRPNYDYMPQKRSFYALNKSSTSFMNGNFRDENRISGDFIKKMKDLGVSRIEDRMFHKSKAMKLGDKHRLMSSLEKQKSLFEKNKNII